MEHVEFVTEIVTKNDWFCSIDLSDAYFSIPVAKSDWKYLKFYWDGKLYSYTVLVFGLSVAPRLFTKICKPVLAHIRGKLGVRCSLYIDDMILMHSNRDTLVKQVSDICNVLSNLGFTINKDKSSFNPTRQIKHLGMCIDSEKLTLSIPFDKGSSLVNKCQEVLSKANCISIRKVASLIGSIVACSTATRWGKLYYRKLENENITNLRIHKGNFDSLISLSKTALDNIRWWLSEEKYIPASFANHSFDFEIFSDASLQGWGGHSGKVKSGGRWNPEEATNHINWLELKASWLCLLSFASHTNNVHISMKLDNTCAITYINAQGGVIKSLDKLANELWLWCKQRNIWLTASHIPGSQNTVADKKSRVFHNNTEWSLSDDIFSSIIDKWGVPDIDLFASRLNFKVKPYISWEADPHSFGVDAFSINWNSFKLCYAFPPFKLIGKVLSKLKSDKAEMLLIAPDWSTQHWYPIIKDLMLHPGNECLKLPTSRYSLFLPFSPNTPHPIWRNLNLVCYRLSTKR